MAIDLTFDEPQHQLQLDAHELFSARCPTSVVRDLEVSAVGYQPDLWHEMAERGWLGLAFPSAYGGARRYLPGPVPPLRGDGTIPRAEPAPRYRRPRRRCHPASRKRGPKAAGPAGHRGGALPGERGHFRAERGVRSCRDAPPLPAGHNGDFTVSGTKLLVAFAPSADYLLVPARTTGQGVTLFLLDAGGRRASPRTP